jgi:hypothetical protein
MLGTGRVLPSPTLAGVPGTLLETPVANLFGAAPAISDPQVSPDGTQLIFIQQTEAGVPVLGS